MAPNIAPWAWRDGLSLECFGGYVWMFGGWNPTIPAPTNFVNTTTNEVWRTPVANLVPGIVPTWTLVGLAPWAPRHLHGSCNMGDRIVIVGGDTHQGDYQRDVWSFNGSTWTQKTADWGDGIGDRLMMQVAPLSGSLYLFGGQVVGGGSTVYSDTWRSDDDGATWVQTSATADWYGGAVCGHAVLDGWVYNICPGTYGDGGVARVLGTGVWRTRDGVTWEQRTADTLFPARQFHTVSSYGGKLRVFGGGNIASVNLQDVWSSSDYGANWVEDPVPPWAATHAAACTTVNTDMMFGGGNGGLRGLWRLTAP